MSHLVCFEPDQSRYELEELLGEGLNSKVYRAVRRDASGQCHQRVALKFLKDQTAVSFLRREFETLMTVRSAHCARVIAWESQNGEPALAMEWIDGVSLFELARSVSLSKALVDEICRQIYLGLDDLRAAGLFHGDLQPSNVMIDRQGCVRLIDFASGQSADGFLQATPAFAAPEVWLSGALGFEADLFALGVLREHLSSSFSELQNFSSVDQHEAKVSGAKLLNKDPKRRSWNPPAENPGARTQIAQNVERLLATASASPLSTQILPLSNLLKNNSPSQRKVTALARTAAVLALILFFGVTLPVMAEGPSDFMPASGTLSISSEHWMQIQINGREAGYAPLSIAHLTPGPFRIAWKSASGAGELKILLSEQSTIHLSETRSGKLEVR